MKICKMILYILAKNKDNKISEKVKSEVGGGPETPDSDE